MNQLECFASAYLLDASGESDYQDLTSGREDQIKVNYQAAIEKDPTNVIYRYHYLSYLDSRGSGGEFWRQVDQLLPLLKKEIPYHTDLICAVLEMKFHEPHKALEYLNKLPDFDNWRVSYLRKKLEIHQNVDENSVSFYPGVFETVDWYLRGPLLLNRTGLTHWGAGRIVEVEDCLTIAVYWKEGERLLVSWLEWDTKKFYSHLVNHLEEGDLMDAFLEVGTYGEDMKIMAFPPVNAAMMYQTVFPADNRFLRSWK